VAEYRYPRPDMERTRWLSLDGEWDFEFDPGDRGLTEEWRRKTSFDKKIRVPFCVESEAGGIGVKDPPPVFWYARHFSRSELPLGKRFFLNFGAVDYECDLWLNGSRVGSHRGGYTPFCFEITSLLEEANRLVVRVKDRRAGRTLRGKQLVHPWLSPIFYTPVSGIWQPVFIFATGESRVTGLQIAGGMESMSISWQVDAMPGSSLTVSVCDPVGHEVHRELIPEPQKNRSLLLHIANPHPWSPGTPGLYSVILELAGAGGVNDRVTSYAGLRSLETGDGKFYLNGEPLSLRMLLVQGYYPGGHYTPADGAVSYERDILLFKSMGFNGIRVHQKIEDPRFLHCCDRLGLLVWEEMPSPFLFGGLDEAQYEEELFAVMERDFNHPSVMAMVLFNETWGIYDLLWKKSRRTYLSGLYSRVKDYNPRLLVVDNSGFDHVLTDIVDVHHYLASDAKARELYAVLGDRSGMTARRCGFARSAAYHLQTHRVAKKPFIAGGRWSGREPFVVSEFGGAGHYKTGRSILESFSEGVTLMKSFPAIAGYCLTQAYDVEGERNGLLTFHREPKYPVEQIRAVNRIFDEDS
jgi:hypothetical protein